MNQSRAGGTEIKQTSMTNQGSLMEQVNVNRARREASSLDDLNRTLEILEGKLRKAMASEPAPQPEQDDGDLADRFARLASRAGASAASQRGPERAYAPRQADGKHDLSAVAAQLKELRASDTPHGSSMSRLRLSTADRAAPRLEHGWPERTGRGPSILRDVPPVKYAGRVSGESIPLPQAGEPTLPASFMRQMDERLDEISRAIVATARPADRHADTDRLDRLEARIASLAGNVEAALDDRFSDTLLQRMGELAHRVETLAGTTRPSVDIDALSDQLAAMSRHLQNAPAAINISDFRELEQRVVQIIDKLETMSGHGASDELALRMDERFSALTRRLDDQYEASAYHGARLADNIDARFEDMAQYIAANVPPAGQADAAIRNLELQIAGLAEHLSLSNERYAQVASITPRLDAIEDSLAANRDFVIEAARQAAIEAIGNAAGFETPHDSAIARQLADDLKVLEGLARKSEDRNTKTFEAIHDTLLKIVDRLASLESAPAPVGEAAEPAAAEADGRKRNSLLGGITRSFDDHTASDDDGQVEPAINLDSGPSEPGSVMPDLDSILKRVRDDRREKPHGVDLPSTKSDLIAAARRAAHAAAAEAEEQEREPAMAGEDETPEARRGFFSRRRKPILIAISAIMIAIAGLQIKNAFFTEATAPETAASVAQPATEAVQPTDSTPAVSGETDAGPTGIDATDSSHVGAIEPAEPAAPATIDEAIVAAPPATPEPAPVQAETPPAEAIPAVPLEAGPDALRDAAASGDTKALYEIGNRFMDGRGVSSDYAKAAQWYELAATRGFAPAQYRLGNFFEKGLGVERDLAKAREWYRQAAEQGNTSAMHNLAVLFAAGADGAPDNAAAAQWFNRAAEYGVKDSQFNLGILAAKGMGMAQNLEESYQWFALAANAGDKDAASKRDEVAKVLDAARLERARAATALWKARDTNSEANAPQIPAEWQDAPTVTGSADIEKAVRNIQLILKKNGYDTGGSDGKIGAKTREAIMAFQKDNGLAPTGTVDSDLVRNLLKKKGWAADVTHMPQRRS